MPQLHGPRTILLLALAASVAACRQERAAPAATGARPAGPPAAAQARGGSTPAASTRDTLRARGVSTPAPSTRDTLRDTLLIEGSRQAVTLVRFRTPPGFPLPFSTYVPSDMLAQATPGGAAFVANFAGVRNDGAALRLLPQPGGEAEARRQARALAVARGASVPAAGAKRFAWSVAEYPFSGRDRVGVVALGRHGSQWFVLVLEYPPEYGDGFGPRAARILRELRWADDGSALAGVSGGS